MRNPPRPQPPTLIARLLNAVLCAGLLLTGLFYAAFSGVSLFGSLAVLTLTGLGYAMAFMLFSESLWSLILKALASMALAVLLVYMPWLALILALCAYILAFRRALALTLLVPWLIPAALFYWFVLTSPPGEWPLTPWSSALLGAIAVGCAWSCNTRNSLLRLAIVFGSVPVLLLLWFCRVDAETLWRNA